MPALLLSICTPQFLASSCVPLCYFIRVVPQRECFVHELLISCSHSEWYLFFSDSAITSAQCVFGAKNYKLLSTGKP